MSQLEHVHLKEDEFEALRLVDLLGMQQQEAAVAMGVSDTGQCPESSPF
jgi:predicted DNA-binding protein (UPF0251 family)